MPLKSDLTVDSSKFDRGLADEQTKQFNQKLIDIWKEGPRWYEVKTFPLEFTLKIQVNHSS